MKKYSILLSAAFVIFALASCQKTVEGDIQEEKPFITQEGSIPFELVANIPDASSKTKTTLNPSTWAVNWEDGDIIYAVTADEEWGQPYSSDKSGATIAEFTYSSVSGSFTTEKTISDGDHTFNFLYTNGTQKSYHRGASTTFQLAGTQDCDASDPTANLKNYDVMAAQVAATTPTTFVDVNMSHLFTLMKVTIKNSTGASVTATKFEMTVASGTYLNAVETVTFGATPSVVRKSGGSNSIFVNIANGTIANGTTKDIYFVIAPLTSYTGDITFTVTDSNDNVYSRTNTISSALTLAAGTYNTATHTLSAIPTINTSSENYTTGFEEDFTAASTFSDPLRVDGPSGQQWATYYGTTSTTDKITGSNSTQMRWYTGTNAGKLGYAETNFYLSNVGYVEFNAKATNGLKAGLYYKRNSDSDWVLARTFTPATSKTLCAHAFDTPLENAKLRIAVVLPSPEPGSASRLTIDDVIVKATATSYTLAIADGITNGTIATSPVPGSVKEGTLVTITPTPNSGCALKSLSVKDAEDKNVTVVDNTFTMPSKNATVHAEFGQLYTISTSATNGSIAVSPSSPVLAGTEVTITATPDDGYAFSSWSISGGVVPASTTATTTTFTMPEENVTVTGTFVELGGNPTITINETTNGVVSTSPSSSAAVGSTVTITVTPNSGYILNTLVVKNASNEDIAVNASNQFTMPASNVTITATFAKGYMLTNAQVVAALSASEITTNSYGTLTFTSTPNNWTGNVNRKNDLTYIQMRNKSGSKLQSPTFPYSIDKVVITVDASQGTSRSMHLIPSSTEVPTTSDNYADTLWASEYGSVMSGTGGGDKTISFTSDATSFILVVGGGATYIDAIKVFLK